jgi:hypothetical protein
MRRSSPWARGVALYPHRCGAVPFPCAGQSATWIRSPSIATAAAGACSGAGTSAPATGSGSSSGPAGFRVGRRPRKRAPAAHSTNRSTRWNSPAGRRAVSGAGTRSPSAARSHALACEAAGPRARAHSGSYAPQRAVRRALERTPRGDAPAFAICAIPGALGKARQDRLCPPPARSPRGLSGHG